MMSSIKSDVGRVKVFCCGQARRSVADTARMLAETFPQPPPSLCNVNVVAAATLGTVYNIFRLTGEVVAGVICTLGAL